jgi:hypothetical protein
MTGLPDFTKIALDGGKAAGAPAPATDAIAWESPEGIGINPVYTAADTAGLDFLDSWFPFSFFNNFRINYCSSSSNMLLWNFNYF